tara:strand:+ start:473 stop:781 length:309 start_codon:yes stop_codon:yes gene_type:complete
MSETKFTSFKEFYPYYLSEHKLRINKVFHVLGSISGLLSLIIIIFSKKYMLLPLPLFIGYLFAWIGHFVFEKNKPATFKYPFYSFVGDWIMLKDIITKKIRL